MANARWSCPTCDDTVLAPTKPRTDDTRRYCLPCSAKKGRLVRRVALALEKARMVREAARKERVRKTASSKRAREDAYYTIDGIDLRAVLKTAWTLPIAKEWRERRRLPTVPPTLTVRRATAIRSRLGFAYPDHHRISVTVPKETPSPPIGTLLHEVAHVLVGKDEDGRWHGLKFRACLTRLCEDYRTATGVVVGRVQPHRARMAPELPQEIAS